MWWRGILHHRLHPWGGTYVLQNHPSKLQLAVTDLQDSFQQRTEVPMVAYWRHGGVPRRFLGCSVGSFPNTIGEPNACMK